MTRTTNPSVVADLLAELGMTGDEQLWAIANAPEHDATDRARSHLAQQAALALGRIGDAERQAGQHLARIAELHGYEVAKLAGGLRGDAMWLAQSAGHYAEALGRLQAGVEDFRAAAHPLKLLAGLTPGQGTAATNTAAGA